ncbi:hypothetical protein [Chitinophaga flava]|uniref:Uncharacterized protein n=1 Tax=Chitinophaga flava TaxID=2259036 RepID=A0A365Y1A6_9BACT|nr:hypothetical protein [Chitinophaga flava]RBL92393.1 hypothetical protein DF182_07345 [Chitinophaga flava]
MSTTQTNLQSPQASTSVKQKHKIRKPKYFKREVNEISNLTKKLNDEVISKFEELLSNRGNSNDRLEEDDNLFIPLADVYALSLTESSFLHSVVKGVSDSIEKKILSYENENQIKVNKHDLYFIQALLASAHNDYDNGLKYWELSEEELAKKNKKNTQGKDLIGRFRETFPPLYNPASEGYHKNEFIYFQFKLLLPFDDYFKKLRNNADLFHFLSCSLKSTKILKNLRLGDNLVTNKIQGQELIHSLSVLCESVFKNNYQSKEQTLGGILTNDLKKINLDVWNYIYGPSQNLSTTYKVKSVSQFNNHFVTYLNELELAAKDNNDVKFKAMLIYFAFVLRNQILHQNDDGMIYLLNVKDTEKVIGIMFASVSAILTL